MLSLSIYRQWTSTNSYYEKNVATGAVRCIDGEIPFDIPQGWEWCRLGSIIDFSKQTSVRNEDIAPDEWLLDLEDIEKDSGIILRKKTMSEASAKSDKHKFSRGNVLYSKLRPYLNKVVIADDDGVCTSEILAFDFGQIDGRYAQTYLMSPFFVDYAMSDAYGVKMPRLGSKQGNNALFPIPPLREQSRIVSRIDSITSHIRIFGKYEQSIKNLNSTIKERLHKSVLQEAIQGRLVPQIESEGTADELLDEIRSEKQRLVKEGKLKKSALANESRIFRGDDNKYYENKTDGVVCIDEDIPFEIPDSWTWVRLDHICLYIQRGKSPKYSLIKQIPVVAQKCNQWSGFSIDKAQFIDPNSLPSYGQERFLMDGDLMWNSTGLGTLGRMAIYWERLNPYNIAVADSHVTVIRPFRRFVISEYLFAYFTSNTVQSVIEDKSEGSTKQKELSTTTVKNYLVPLPPYHEQERIIKKINEALASIMSR